MKRLSKWWLLLLGSLILVVFPLGILYLSAVDNTEKLVHALLFQPNGNLDEQTFSAAMIARFPKGTKVSELTSFVNSLKGQCNAVGDDKLNCSLDVSGSFCVATKIGLDVKISADGKVESVNAKKYFIGC